MIIHSDHMITGILKIEKTDKGFVFSNPGNLKLPLKRIYEDGHSVARNPKIQTMFRMIGYGDNIGSGFPTILSAWGEENWRKPDLRQNDDLHQVDLKLWMASLMPGECTEYLQALYGWVYTRLDRDAQIILGTAYLEKSVTNSRLQSVLNKSGVEVGRILLTLVDRGLLLTDRNGRWTSYRLNEEYQIPAEQMEIDAGCSDEILFRTETDQIIFEYTRENGFVTSSQVLQITKLTTRQGAALALSRLVNRGLLRMTGKGKLTIYECIQ